MTDTNAGKSLGPKRATFALWKWWLLPIVFIFIVLVTWTFAVQGIKWVKGLGKECPPQQQVAPCKCSAPAPQHECKKSYPKPKKKVPCPQVTPSPPKVVYVPAPAPPPIVVEKVVIKEVPAPAPPPVVVEKIVVKERVKTHIIHEEPIEEEPTHEYRRVRRPRVEYEEDCEPYPRRPLVQFSWGYGRQRPYYQESCPPPRYQMPYPQYRPHVWNPPHGSGPMGGPANPPLGPRASGGPANPPMGPRNPPMGAMQMGGGPRNPPGRR